MPAVALQLLFLLAVLSVSVTVSGVSESDLVRALPGQPQVSFRQFAGYVTVDEQKGRALFYYFAEAQTNSSAKPLVIWFNGGPACSSVGIGAFTENGPFQPKKGRLVRNGYSWNKEANMLYVESPAGVGFSYSNDSSDYVDVDDDKTANDNLRFVYGWFRKFPEYSKRDLFLAGESYAGHYIPQLANLMLKANLKSPTFNLKGIALGNPVLEFSTDFNARGEYLWSHGLISDITFQLVKEACNFSQYVDQYYRGRISSVCGAVYALVNAELSNFIDRYDVTSDICVSSIQMHSNKLRLGSVDVCVEDEATAYLNMPSVQKALHARLHPPQKAWRPCSQKVVAYNNLNLEIPMTSLLAELLKSGLRIVVYSGDQDSVIPLTGTRSLIRYLAIALEMRTSVAYRVWFERKQVGGWTEVYGRNSDDVALTYATVRGASHEAPWSQPRRSFLLFTAFLRGSPLPSVAHSS